jgi:NAD(P)-dependent dehydrogenase (short-subunit alcohol dehydrogenase family)
MENVAQSVGGEVSLVVGASGGIGRAVVGELLERGGGGPVIAVSRSPALEADSTREGLRWYQCEHTDADIDAVVSSLLEGGQTLGRVMICPGVLHDGALQPEKALERLQRDNLQRVLEVNTVIPALWLSALTPLLCKSPRAVVAVLSARVGSIADNRLGGWYSYRASKAALNMLLKTASVELARRAPGVKVLAFHPGTTDTGLSRPFQARVPADKLFGPDFVARQLLEIMDRVIPDGEVEFLDWAGKPIPW